MKYVSTVIAVNDIKSARKFYEDLFGLEIYTDYGINISFTCGLSLQQDFEWLINLSKDQLVRKNNTVELCFEEDNFDAFLIQLKTFPEIEYVGEVKEQSWGQRVIRFYDLDGHLIEVGETMKFVIKRFLKEDRTLEEISKKMDVSLADLTKLLNE